MKVKDFDKKYPPKPVPEGEEGPCELCDLHDRFGMHETTLRCPKCEAAVPWSFVLRPVGSSNTMGDDDEIRFGAVTKCTCGATIALLPVEIQYNGNHSVYYTGGRNYLHREDTDRLRKRLKEISEPLIRNWEKRIRAGESLETWNLECWLENAVEKVVAETLVELGRKLP